MAIKVHRAFAIHPGPWLREEVVNPYRLAISEVAKRLGVTRVAMSNLLNGKAALSPDMAIRFEKAFGISAATLMRMQVAHDLVKAEEAAKSIKIDRIPEPA